MENDVLYNRIMNVIHEEYGEGSTAVANPEGEPTDDLTSIQIGDEIYGISGGGGASGMVLTGHAVGDDWVFDYSYTEVKTAIEAGIVPIYLDESPAQSWIFSVESYGFNQEQNKYYIELRCMGDPQTTHIFGADTSTENLVWIE